MPGLLRFSSTNPCFNSTAGQTSDGGSKNIIIESSMGVEYATSGMPHQTGIDIKALTEIGQADRVFIGHEDAADLIMIWQGSCSRQGIYE